MDLTSSDKKILQYYLGLDSQFFRSLIRIAHETGVSIKTVQRANQKLRDMGVLRWISGNGDRQTKGVRAQVNAYSLEFNKMG